MIKADSAINASAMKSVETMRRQLKSLFHGSMNSVDVRNVLTHQMTILQGCLQVGMLSYPLGDWQNIVLIGVGKASVPMCSIAAQILRPSLRENQRLRGIAVGPESSKSLPPEIAYFFGSHPFPNEDSRRAADAVSEMLRPLGENDLVLFLLSGGASSMLEAPIDPDTSVEEIAETYRSLVYSGLPIVAINALRKHLSAVKGGRLAALAAPATQLTLIISDVPGKAFDMVGSGLSLPDPSTTEECLQILSEPAVRAALGTAVLRRFVDRPLEETPKPNDAAFARSSVACLLSNQDLLDQAAILARNAGYFVEIDNSCDEWDYRDASRHLLAKLRGLREQHEKVCLISGGEVLVKMTGASGRGGRNQHFALHIALALAASEPYVAMFSAGSDGVDGNSPAAGAFADSFTVNKAESLGLAPAGALERFDSYSLFSAMDDAIVTGPTGNNIRDLRIFLSA